jgi:DtxR family Mn-dependent transcriptional regulator
MYLVMIALLRQDNQPVPLSLLANKLSISPVSANEMCRKLEERGLVAYQPYKGVTLTEPGEAEAQEVLSRRRLWVIFLVDNLGIEPDEADEIACQLEHITSERLVQSLKAFLEHAASRSRPAPALPGEPQPQAADLPASQPLTTLSAGTHGHITAINADAVMRDFLQAQGITPGTALDVLAVGTNGSLLLNLGGAHCSLAHPVAAHIEVAPGTQPPQQQGHSHTWRKCSHFWSCRQRGGRADCEECNLPLVLPVNGHSGSQHN